MARFSHTERGRVKFGRMPTGSPQHACASRHRRERGVGAGSAVDLGQLLVGGPLVVVGLARLEAREQLGVAALEAVVSKYSRSKYLLRSSTT